jgi:hypothetical protein
MSNKLSSLYDAHDAQHPSCLGPLHLMLADALSPHGSNATLASVGTLSEGFERFVTSPLYLVGYVRWNARSDQSSFVKQSLQQLSGRNPRTRLVARLADLTLRWSLCGRLRADSIAGITSKMRPYVGMIHRWQRLELLRAGQTSRTANPMLGPPELNLWHRSPI